MFDSPVVSGRGPMPGRDIIVVSVKTDAGITGESFITGLHLAQGAEIKVLLCIIREALACCLVGEAPLCIERIWNRMYQSTRRFGRRGAVLRAMSAMDMALWDILGKYANLPLYKLLGANSDTIPVYASGGHYSDDETLAAEMKRYLAAGFRAVKMRVGRASIKRDTERLHLVRKTIGDDIDLMIDAGEGWDVPTAVRAMTRWADLDLVWLEEPISSDDIDGLVRIKAATPVPIAVGENEFSRYGFRDLVKAGAVDIIQADVSRVGGITEWIKIAHFAAAHDIRMAPHSFQEIHVSLLGAVGNALMLEIFQPEHPFQQMICEFFVIPPEIKTIVDGRVSMPQKPGLGLSVNWEYARQYQVRGI
jgi:D-arabinonate dehydratase